MGIDWAGAVSALDRINTSQPTALAEVLAVVAAINSELETKSTAQYPVGRLSTSSFGPTAADVLKKLREWLDKLIEKLKEIVRTVNAESFSVTVGSQVSVSVTFRTE
jgi:hypothetical protein